MFVDRKRELELLRRLYSRLDSSMTIVYGRRRLGKTTLLRQFVADKPALYYLATTENELENRKAFQKQVADFTGNAFLRAGTLDSWDVLFQALSQAARERKVVVVLDEFQYLGKANPAFPSILQRAWDSFLQQSNVMLILCGSLVHMMESQTLNYTSPLYGRRSAQIKLRPIPFSAYGAFYPEADRHRLLELYSITGGVPKYAEVFQPLTDLGEMIEQNMLDPMSFLFEEPAFLLQGEVKETGSYFSILKSVAAGNQTLGAIASSLELPQSSLTQYLRTLSELDILQREVPVTEQKPEKSKRGLYRLQDNFLRFWFRFVYPYRSLLEIGQMQQVKDTIRRDFVSGHLSRVYEDICREQTLALCSDGRWPLSLQKVGRWWDRNSEIDVVGIGTDAVLFGECKYWKQPVGLNVLDKLRAKSSSMKLPPGCREHYYALFAPAGFTPEVQELAQRDSHVLLAGGDMVP